MIDFKAPETVLLNPFITVWGVGGAGSNAVDNMINANLQGVKFVVVNTDAQSLNTSLSPIKIQIGGELTRGLGAGASPERGREAAEESIEVIKEQLMGSHMLFITAGEGGGTGTGASPVIARAAKELGILTVGVVTKPFHFEGLQRMKTAEKGVIDLQNEVDTLVVIPNQNLFRVANENTTFAEAFKIADDVLHAGVRGVTDLIIMPGLINLDFADINSVMQQMGRAMMGTGEATGEGRAIKAAEAAISNPLLDNSSMKGAKGVLINITGSENMTLYEVDAAANRVIEEVGDSNANIIFGSAYNPELKDCIRVSVVATGIGNVVPPMNITTPPLEDPEKTVIPEEDFLHFSEKLETNTPVNLDNFIVNETIEPVKNEIPIMPSTTMSIPPEILPKTEKKTGMLGKVWNSLMSRPDKNIPSTPPIIKQSIEYQESLASYQAANNKAEIHEIPTFLRKQR